MKPELTLEQFAQRVNIAPEDIELYYPWLLDVNGRFLGPGHDRAEEMIDPTSGDIVPLPTGTIVPPQAPPSATTGTGAPVFNAPVAGTPQGFTPPVPTKGEQKRADVHDVLTSANSDEDQARALLQSAGVDPNFINLVLTNPSMVANLIGRDGPTWASGLAAQHPAQTNITPYGQAREQFGFAETPAPPAALPTPFLVGPPGQEVPKPIPPELTRDYELNKDTGGIRYSNGVIVDPAQQQVFFPPGSDVPGSPNWLNEIRGSWSTKQVSEWRKRLASMGYLSPDQAKSKGFDQAFLDALSNYHRLRYLNFGKPTALDLSKGAGAAKPQVVIPDAVFIRQNVRAQYQRAFGTEPSKDALEQWTGFVQGLAGSLQRKQEYSPSRAAAVAGERATEAIQQSPDAQFIQESDKENTDLHDALISAVQVTRSLTG